MAMDQAPTARMEEGHQARRAALTPRNKQPHLPQLDSSSQVELSRVVALASAAKMPLRIVRRKLFEFKYTEQQVKISRPTINLSINKNV
jgi:hypothetical protein